MQSAHFSSDDERAYCRHIKDRVQKITEAMYRVSELFPEKEPLRWQLRQAALQIFNDFSTFEEADLHQRSEAIRNAPAYISRVCSLVDLASAGSLISHFNFDVLRREYTALLSFILEHKSFLGTIDLPKLRLPAFSKTPNTAETGKKISFEAQELAQGLAKENNVRYTTQTTPNSHIGHVSNSHFIGHNKSPIENVRYDNRRSTQSESQQQQEQQKNADVLLEQSQGQEGEKFSAERKQQIIRFMKTHSWVSVGDLTSVFKGKISEKTLQRDLVGMVERGVLKKEGDKRWRRYTINFTSEQHQ